MAKDTTTKLVAGIPTVVTTSDDIEDFTNAADAVSVGEAVYINGNGSVAVAANTDTAQEAIGLVFEVVDSTNCRVITSGLLETFSTGMTANDRFYLDTAGALTTTKPTASGTFAQVVGIAYNATDMFICPQVGVTDLALTTSTEFISVRRTAASTSLIQTEYNPFGTDNGGTVSTDGDSGDITFVSATGVFTIPTTGAWEVNVALYLIQSTSTNMDTFILEKNGTTTIWTGNAIVHSSVDPTCRSFSTLVDLTSGDTLQVRIDSNSTANLQSEVGCCITLKKVEGVSEYISVRRTVASSTQAAEFNPLGSNNGGTIVTDADSGDITFVSTTGIVTIPTTGAWEFNVSLYLIQSALGNMDTFILEKNGTTTLWTGNAIVHSTVDPTCRSFYIIVDLTAADTIEVRLDSSGANTLIAEIGCTMTAKRID